VTLYKVRMIEPRRMSQTAHPQVYLHIGFHKTGTSALQERFNNRREQLAGHNIIYPEATTPTRGHHDIPLALDQKRQKQGVNDQDFASTQEHYLAQFPKEGAHYQIVVSSENFIRLTDEAAVQQVSEFFEGYPVKCVAYVRDAKSYLASRYIHFIHTRAEQRPFRRFVRQMLWECDFAIRLQPYANMFGRENMIVRPYDGDTVTDFLANVLKTEFTLPDPERRVHSGMHIWLKEVAMRINNSDLDEKAKKDLFAMLRTDVTDALPEVDREAFLWEQSITETFQPQIDTYAQMLYDEYGVDLRK